MAKLLLHAGTHKTGTTAIQQFAVMNKSLLQERGIIYPGYNSPFVSVKDGHHQFGHAISDIPRKKLSFTHAKMIAREWKESSDQHQLPILVSVEAVYRHKIGNGSWKAGRLDYLARLAEVLHDFDVTVILVFRRPDKFAKSLFLENIATGTQAYKSFYHWRNSSKKYLFNYLEAASLFKNIFGKLNCLIYEDLSKDHMLIQNFFSKLGINTAGMRYPGVVRRSLSPIEATLKNYANSLDINRKTGRKFLAWLKSSDTQEKIRDYYGCKEYDVWTSISEQQQFLESRHKDLTGLSEKFFDGRQIFDLNLHHNYLSPVPSVPEGMKSLIQASLASLTND